MTKKNKPKKFSAVKAVKANARERIGQPRPQRAMEDSLKRPDRKKKHKESLGQLMIEGTPLGVPDPNRNVGS